MKSHRREFLKGTVIVAGSVFSFVSETQGHGFLSLLIEPQDKAEPILFESPEVMTLAAIASQIIPTTDQPGAAEVGVVIYINSEVRKSAEMTRLYREGLAGLDKASHARFNQPFHRAGWDNQTQMLKAIEKGPFFPAIRRHTVEAFYTSPVGVYVASGSRATAAHGLCIANEGYPDIDQKPKN